MGVFDMIRLLQERNADHQSSWSQQLPGSVESHTNGTTLYQPGEQATALLVLLAGKVGLFLRSEEGRSLTLKMVEPGQLFGHVALTDPTYDAYAEALSDIRVLRVAREEAQEQIKNDSGMGLALLEEMGRYRQVVSQCLDELAFKSVPARLASHLLALANRHGMNMPRVSHRQLAEQINAYRETVTKVINQFRAAHLLEIDTSTIRLLNLSRLEELAQG
jgi:CRP/FNR family transcriptional regulator, cyclic AMP receptor protein